MHTGIPLKEGLYPQGKEGAGSPKSSRQWPKPKQGDGEASRRGPGLCDTGTAYSGRAGGEGLDPQNPGGEGAGRPKSKGRGSKPKGQGEAGCGSCKNTWTPEGEGLNPTTLGGGGAGSHTGNGPSALARAWAGKGGLRRSLRHGYPYGQGPRPNKGGGRVGPVTRAVVSSVSSIPKVPVLRAGCWRRSAPVCLARGKPRAIHDL